MAIQTMIAAILSSGTIGVADQYLCLLLLSIAAQTHWVQLPEEVSFMASIWFLVFIGVIWVATVLPAYGTLIDPIVLRIVNTTTGLISGVVVPASGALLALATANFVAPSQMAHATSANLWLLGGGGAAVASTVSFAKFLIKPAVATATGLTGTNTGPAIYKTIENIASLILMIAIYLLGSLDPWLLVALMLLVVAAFISLLVFVVHRLWLMKQGFGKVLRLFKTNPKAGWALVLETVFWGVGWFLMKGWRPGILRFALWVICLGFVWFVLPLVFVFIPPMSLIIPLFVSFVAIYFFGLSSSRKLLKVIEKDLQTAGYSSTIVGQAAN
jgi:hypothetical protein